jgi:arginine-tRNA-protein transferase
MGGNQDKMAEQAEGIDECDQLTRGGRQVESHVQFAYQPGGPYPSHCGYCHSENEQFKLEGLWSNAMSVRHFQELVDRGFQRSGKFVYLPVNNLTCCPQFVMRLDSATFKISKQQRRVVRRLNEYLVNGLPDGAEEQPIQPPPQETMDGACNVELTKKAKKSVTPGKGIDPSKPPCRKAKDVRREKREIKLAQRTVATEDPPISASVSMETMTECTDLSKEMIVPTDTKHKLITKLIKVNPPADEFEETFEQSYEVFRKFQMIIHKEPPEKCEREHFMQFCVESPLTQEDCPSLQGKAMYGSYHQQYWLDDTLVMVGVLDILPKGILCNYLYYDPKYRYIAPGVYSALYEISMTQSFYHLDPQIRYYYMGYYVHDCPKMNYKRHYHSSYLLCPDTLTYVPLSICRAKLDTTRVCRFADDSIVSKEEDGSQQEDTSAIDDVLMVPLFRQGIVKYSQLRQEYRGRFDDLVKKYKETVGGKLSREMVLHLTGLT